MRRCRRGAAIPVPMRRNVSEISPGNGICGRRGEQSVSREHAIPQKTFGQPTVITTAAVENGHVDKCLELLNFLYSEEGSEIVNWGVEGVSYTKDADGNHIWTEAVTNDPDYPMSDAVFKYALPTLGGWPKAMSYEAWGSMNLRVEDQIITHKNYAACDSGLDLPGFALNMEEQDTYSRIITDVNTAVSETYWNVVTGKKPIEELDSLLELVKSMGVADAVAAYQSAYSRYLER